ncbi:NAD-binding protein [Mesorhizobium sp. M0663]
MIGRLLDERGYRWVAVDLDAKNVERSRKERLPIFFGNASKEEMVAAAKIDSAKALVITLDDPEAAKSVLAALRRKLPDLPVIVRARHHMHVQELLEKGATTVMPETTESSLLLGAAVLQELGDSKTDVDAAVRTVRRRSYPRPQAGPAFSEPVCVAFTARGDRTRPMQSGTPPLSAAGG